MHIATFLPLVVLPLAWTKTFDIDVGIDKDKKEDFVYTPETITAVKDDKLVFHFYEDQEHSVVQSSFDKPCQYQAGGIYSGFPNKNQTFTVTVNGTDPIWLFCSRGNHCQRGQSLVVNAPTDKTLTEYKAAAKNSQGQNTSGSPPPVSGGVIALADTAASSSSSSAASSATSKASESASSASKTNAATATSASGTAPAATSSGAAGRFTVGAGLGAMGLLGFLAGGMI